LNYFHFTRGGDFRSPLQITRTRKMLRTWNGRFVKVIALLVMGVVSGPGPLTAATHSVDRTPGPEAVALNPALTGKTVIVYFTTGGSQRGVCKGIDQDSIALEINGNLHVYELAFVREIEVVR
jgi:hypothetical protein